MKKIFTKLLIPATGLVILPIVASCSQQTYQEETSTLEIVSKIEDVTVAQEQTHLSEPIKTKCLGPDKTEKQLDVKFNLKIKGNDQLPNWISITDKNEIQLTGGKEVGTYTFTLSAYNTEHKLQSATKTFTVNVIEQRHILPDSLTINCETDQYYMYGIEHKLPITVTPSKEGEEEQYLINEVTCSAIMTAGKSTDTKGKPVISYLNEDSKHYLRISGDLTEGYTGDYAVRINVALVADPTIIATTKVKIHIENLYKQHDRKSGCTFTRDSVDDPWTLSSIDSSVAIVNNVPSVIQHKNVEIVGKNAASNANLAQVILPDTIWKIEESAFENQTGLSSVEMPGVTTVGINAFSGDSIMEYRTGAPYPKLLTVESGAFANCKQFKIDELNDIVEIGDSAFINAGLRNLTIGENCKKIGNSAFAGCPELSKCIILAKKPPENGGSIFYQSDQLKSIKVLAESLDAYNSDSRWSSMGIKFEGI